MRVKNFAGFMKTRLNESDDWSDDKDKNEWVPEPSGIGMNWGANPEEENVDAPEDAEPKEEEEQEEVTLEDLKAMVDDLTARVETLEGGGEKEETEETEETDEETPEETEEGKEEKNKE